jgi:hypothetical protein
MTFFNDPYGILQLVAIEDEELDAEDLNNISIIKTINHLNQIILTKQMINHLENQS